MTGPHGETVIFIRQEGFYPVTLSGKKPAAVEAADHAALNPGTLRIEDMNGNVLWPEGTKQ
jgi:hypothetical protein